MKISMSRKTILTVIFITTILTASLFEIKEKSCKPKPQAPQILVIGDSISEGYTPFAQANLCGVAYLVHNIGNARYTKYTLDHLETYLNQAPNAVLITWNNGLHDISKAELGFIRSTPIEYRANLEKIARRLISLKKPILFFKSTNVPELEIYRNQKDLILYNQIASDVMAKFGIEVVDLYEYSRTIPNLYLDTDKKNNVHFTYEGYKKLGEIVSDSILKKLPIYFRFKKIYSDIFAHHMLKAKFL